MAKFCGKCGSKLDETTALCPNCDSNEINNISVQEKFKQKEDMVQEPKESQPKKNTKKRRAYKKVHKKEKQAKLTIGQKKSRLLMWIMLFVLIIGGVIGGLLFGGTHSVSLFSMLSEKRIVVEEKNRIMDSNTAGTATIIVEMPDYTLLFKEAVISKNPEQYLIKSLILKKYDVRKFEKNANITVQNGITTVDSEEVVNQLLEESLINAINSLSEANNEKDS